MAVSTTTNTHTTTFWRVEKGEFYCKELDTHGNTMEGTLQSYHIVEDEGNTKVRPPIPPGKRVVLVLTDSDGSRMNLKTKPNIIFAWSLASRMSHVPEGSNIRVVVRPGETNDNVSFANVFIENESGSWDRITHKDEYITDEAERTIKVIDIVESHPAKFQKAS